MKWVPNKMDSAKKKIVYDDVDDIEEDTVEVVR